MRHRPPQPRRFDRSTNFPGSAKLWQKRLPEPEPGLRILHIGKFYPPSHGGMERFLGDLVSAQRRQGLDVAVLVHDDPNALVIDDADGVLRAPTLGKFVFAPISPSFPLWLHRTIHAFRPDVIHLHAPNVSAFWALLLPCARRVPWVVHWHADVPHASLNRGLRCLYPFYRPFEQKLLDHASSIVVTSPPYLESSEPLRQWKHKCTVVPLGVDPERLPEVDPAFAHHRWPPSGLRVLAIGRLTYYKGFDTLIRAVAALPDAQLLIVGEGDQRTHLEDVINQEGCAERATLVGALDDDACRELLVSCDILCLPSRERTEAFGIVLMEAMRYGKPVIASRLEGSGMTWVVRDGTNGRLAPVDDIGAWTESLRDLRDQPAERGRLGENGRILFTKELSIEITGQKLRRVYESIVDYCDRRDPPRHGRPLVVIPARNEVDSVGGVVAQTVLLGFDVIVVDDGSTDGTAEAARASGAKVLRPVLPQGAWGAMQTGIRYALRNGYPGVITMDADGQHEPIYLTDLLAKGQDTDVVIGAYPIRGSRARKIAWALFRSLTGFSIEDLTSGFRYYSAPACRILAAEEATLLDYQDVGVLLLLRRAGFAINEIPVIMQPRKCGPSRIFASWWAVSFYMAETTLLCLARWNSSPRATSSQ